MQNTNRANLNGFLRKRVVMTNAHLFLRVKRTVSLYWREKERPRRKQLSCSASHKKSNNFLTIVNTF